MTGAMLRKLREAAGIQQNTLARHLGISKSTLCNIEQEHSVIYERAASIVRGITTLRARSGKKFERLAVQVQARLDAEAAVKQQTQVAERWGDTDEQD